MAKAAKLRPELFSFKHLLADKIRPSAGIAQLQKPYLVLPLYNTMCVNQIQRAQ